MAFSYDLQTPIGKTRLIIPDRDNENPVFSDEELGAFLAMEEQEPGLAAAMALEVIASSEAMTLKVMRLLDLQTDGATLSKELRSRAKDLREHAEKDGAFDWAEMMLSDSARRERILNRRTGL